MDNEDDVYCRFSVISTCSVNFDIEIHSNSTSINYNQVAQICDIHLNHEAWIIQFLSLASHTNIFTFYIRFQVLVIVTFKAHEFNAIQWIFLNMWCNHSNQVIINYYHSETMNTFSAMFRILVFLFMISESFVALIS